MIVDIAQADRWDELMPILASYPSYLDTYRTPADKAVAYLRAQLQSTSRKESGWALGIERRGRMEGLGALEASAWESKIYQLSMAKIPLLMARGSYQDQIQIYDELLSQIGRYAAERGFQHLTCRVDTRDIAQTHSLEAAGFRLMDTTIECLWTPEQLTPEPPAAWIIRPHRESDLTPLERLARQTFTEQTKTRYGVDPYLPLERTGELYVQWLRESARGAFAHIVLVAELDGKPVGFQTLKVDEDFTAITGVSLATFGIGTVSDEQRGKKIFPSLLRGIVRWGEAHGVGFCRGRILIHNVSMQRACFASGAFMGATFYTLHKWLG